MVTFIKKQVDSNQENISLIPKNIPPQQVIAILREIMTKAFQQSWALSELDFNQVIQLNKRIKEVGCDDEIKAYCAFLHWARMEQTEGTEEYGLFAKLEFNLREQCKPLLNKISSFWPSSVTMPDAYAQKNEANFSLQLTH